MEISSAAAFLTLSVLLVLVPGADWAYAIAAGLRDRSVIPAVGGLVLGYVGLTAVVVAGLAAVIAGTPSVLTGLTILGAVYLVWLGVTTVATPAGPPGRVETLAPSARRVLLRGAGTSGLNPKALLLYLALLPQFVDQDGSWPVAAQIGALGLLHILVCAVIYLGVATLARVVLRARPSIALAVTRLSGVAMIAIGVLLLIERLRH